MPQSLRARSRSASSGSGILIGRIDIPDRTGPRCGAEESNPNLGAARLDSDQCANEGDAQNVAYTLTRG
jgi:hypothetical protein